jgi:hypothetical protein
MSTHTWHVQRQHAQGETLEDFDWKGRLGWVNSRGFRLERAIGVGEGDSHVNVSGKVTSSSDES